ncbi:hypothetical protein HBH56_154440 [Parastagonospora nodorum]|uniref:Uncharacterized protein n=1 Tax=Phaeosphaeria nodorum (strain SN15 / ATCC MYA-4574 / FGSC 10173) TaxID=321614 RepID=A0A7U2EZJ9_PHANO|nr:hypothetical protein HBH56_154440 [Parastagonospora nodorum]QRC95935.1 hypothetical protein JI435_433000 [Parastagonospora nodorum SN15]KAH3926687.1 hypothetical protein HBH54_163250 [Parastagonospora nodorum]KAH3970249.1 hypothetical protein HBH52_167620 [Parastagonospora nodorum]KAH3971953.1 hypothetical protein HBH51_105600 [Parastagonospora nodorum]
MESLRRLSLKNLDLQPQSSRLGAWTSVSLLQHLEIQDSQNIGRSLDDSVLDSFLKAFEGLEDIFVSTSSAEFVAVDSLRHHLATLKFVVVNPLNKWDHIGQSDGSVNHMYQSTNLKYMATYCPLIEELGTSLVHVDFEDMEEAFIILEVPILPVEIQPKSALDALATFPNLRVLRLTQPPIKLADEVETAETPKRARQWQYREFAEHIFQSPAG